MASAAKPSWLSRLASSSATCRGSSVISPFLLRRSGHTDSRPTPRRFQGLPRTPGSADRVRQPGDQRCVHIRRPLLLHPMSAFGDHVAFQRRRVGIGLIALDPARGRSRPRPGSAAKACRPSCRHPRPPPTCERDCDTTTAPPQPARQARAPPPRRQGPDRTAHHVRPHLVGRLNWMPSASARTLAGSLNGCCTWTSTSSSRRSRSVGDPSLPDGR